MINFTYLCVLLFCLACSAADEQVQQEEGTTLPPADVASRELTNEGYFIRYGDELYRYPLRIVPFVSKVQQPSQNDPTETNEVENEEGKRRPLFYFTTYELSAEEAPPSRQDFPSSRPYIEIRRKRDVENLEVSESSKVGKLRRKRTYCRKCGGHGGYGGGYGGGYYIPVTYAVYPVYPVYYGGGGGHKGCNTCGGGGGGGGGSFSYSTSSAQSSSGSFGWGK